MDQTKKRIFLSSPTMHGEEQKYIQEAFDTNWVAPLGPNVDALEDEMCDFVNQYEPVENRNFHAAALSAGTAAIHLAVKLLGIGQGDIVFVSSLTFSATCNPIVYEKAVPVFIDSEPDTWNMSPDALRLAFEKYPNPKAVIFVNLYGTPAKIDEICAICREHHTPIIEDAAESLSSTYKGRQTGTFGDLGIFSYNGNKIITTSGGGMLICRDEDKIKKARFLATQARDPAPYYQHSQIGYNYRMSNITAGIGRGQLLHLEEHKAIKNRIYAQYKEAFQDIQDITMNPMNPDGDANNWLSCITLSPSSKVKPEKIAEVLSAENIESRPIWKPMHLQPVFADCDFITTCQSGSISEDIFNRGICLPSDIKNTPEDMEKIISIIKALFVK